MDITLTINGKEVTVEKGTMLLQACEKAGFEIPTLCYDSELKKVGSCRICVVENNGRALLASCVAPAENGMVIETENAAVIEARKINLELMTATHNFNCQVCESNGNCKLQDYCYKYGVDTSRYMDGGRIEYPIDDPNPYIARDYNKCIMCTKCVRVCENVVGAKAISIENRGFKSKIATAFDGELEKSSCIFCGQCIMVCPTGALTSKKSKGQGRSYEIDEKAMTTCTYCGTGCTFELDAKDENVIGVTSNRCADQSPVNRGSLCVKGRFGWDFVNSPDRLKKPMIKENGELRDAEWDEALALIKKRLTDIKNTNGADSIAAVVSPRLTNEDAYAAQKMMRAAVGTNNICNANGMFDLAPGCVQEEMFGFRAMTNSINELEKDTELYFVLGADMTQENPVIGMKVKTSILERGTKLILSAPAGADFIDMADCCMECKPDTEAALIKAIMAEIIKSGKADQEFIDKCTEGYTDLVDSLKACTPEWAAGVTGVPADKIIKAAELFGSAKTAAILYGIGITKTGDVSEKVKALCDLALLTGNIGKPGTGVNVLRRQNNTQGSLDMGCSHVMLPGFVRVAGDKIAMFEKAWNVKLPVAEGIKYSELAGKVADGKIKAVYFIGENPIMTVDDAKPIAEKADFVIVQDVVLSDIAKMADVVLPAATFAEKEGTFTNTERRVQLVRKVVDAPGEAKADWEIISAVSDQLGYAFDYCCAEAIFNEAASLIPVYAGMDYDRLEGKGLQWPCLDKDHPGTAYLYADGKFADGKAKFSII